MIKYLLKCQNKHEFESWFADSKEFEKLRKKNLIDCIFCQSKNISKSIMSPNINSRKKISDKINNKEFNKIKKDLLKLRKFIEKNFEFVGDRFAKEVREVHYNNKKGKNFYGTVSREEKLELEEEGIDLVSVPWPKNKEN
jgi:hypothetical protein